MEKLKHSPAPWHYEDVNGCKDIFSAAYTHSIAEVDSSTEEGVAFTSGLESYEEDLANAKLIAAAPDLLYALQEIVNLHPYAKGIDEAVLAIHKALD